MDIHARHVAVNGRHTQLLPPTSFRIAEGQLALVRCLQEEATALALVLSGRLEPDDGAVLLDGEGHSAGLRAQVAIVDAPRVTEPDPVLPLSTVVAEALCLAGESSSKATVLDWLAEQHAEEYAKYRFETLPAPMRTRLLMELAVIPPQVRVVIMDSPDRHTGDANTWWTVALRQAQRGLGVVVLCSEGSARSLPVDAARVGQMQQPAPLTVSVDGVHIADVPSVDPSMGTQYGDLHFDEEAYEEDDYEHEPETEVAEQQPAELTTQLPVTEQRPEELTTQLPVAEEWSRGSEPHAGEQQYGEHHYGEAQDYTGWAPAGDITSRLSGDEDEAEKPDEPSSAEAGNTEETTTWARVTDRETP